MENPLQEIFIQEAEENLAILEGAIINIEEDPDDSHTINEAFRSIHSIKGGAGLAGFPAIKEFSHRVEDFFEYIRNGTIRTGSEHISIILKSLDIIRLMVNSIKGEIDSGESIESDYVLKEINEFIREVENKPEEAPENEGDQEKKRLFYIDLTYYPEIFNTGIDPLMFISDLEKTGEILHIFADTSTLPEIDEFDPERLYISWRIFFSTDINEKDILDIFCFVIDESNINIVDLTDLLEDTESLIKFSINGKTVRNFLPDSREPEKNKASQPAADRIDVESRKDKRKTGPARKPEQGVSSFIRVQTDKLENIFNTVSELLIFQARLNMLTDEYEDEIPDSFITVTDSLKNITKILQEQITSLRMMNLASTFDRFRRVVRDIASERGKQVKLSVSGQETELDKNMIEKLNDPLKHLVRNCIDHGIETEETRLNAGKSPEGHLSLSAYIENGKVIIEVADDGAGIKREIILVKAKERGIIKKDKILSDGEILNLIFHPGLSTAEKITDLSGRGVGMDVVKNSIMELHGNIEIISEEGHGTKFRLHLPLTLAILDGMLLKIGMEKYIIPTLSILEIFRPLKEHIKTISGKGEVVFFRGEYIQLIRLYRFFQIPDVIEDPAKAELIVIYSGGMKAALLVDSVIDQFQIVLKSLQQNFRKVDYISSATILGNGDVALIIDIQNLLTNRVLGKNV